MHKKLLLPLMVVGFLVAFSSCVPKKQLLSAQDRISRMQGDSSHMAGRIDNLEKNVNKLQDNIAQLESARIALQKQLEATRSEATNRLQDASSKLNMS